MWYAVCCNRIELWKTPDGEREREKMAEVRASGTAIGKPESALFFPVVAKLPTPFELNVEKRIQLYASREREIFSFIRCIWWRQKSTQETNRKANTCTRHRRMNRERQTFKCSVHGEGNELQLGSHAYFSELRAKLSLSATTEHRIGNILYACAPVRETSPAWVWMWMQGRSWSRGAQKTRAHFYYVLTLFAAQLNASNVASIALWVFRRHLSAASMHSAHTRI